jgi:hypothetical protein
MLDHALYQASHVILLFAIAMVAFVAGGIAAHFLFRRRAVRELGRPVSIEALSAKGARGAIVEIEGEKGACTMHLDDRTAYQLSCDLLQLSATLAPREDAATKAGA